MRLEMKMSDSGPLPRSPSPLVWVRLSRFIRGFSLSEQVSDAGGLFVGLGVHRRLQPPPQPDQFGLPLRRRRAVPRDLAHVPPGPVDPPQQRLQAGAEDGV